MNRRTLAGLGGLLATLAGCSSPPPPPVLPPPSPRAVQVVEAPPPPASAVVHVPPQAPDPEPPSAPVAAPAAAGARMFRGRSEDEWLRLMSERPVVRTLERFHSTLFVFHMDLGDGVHISFQPERPGQETFWRREVTSYHLARLLGIQQPGAADGGQARPLERLRPPRQRGSGWWSTGTGWCWARPACGCPCSTG
jgi:hypothetical protein